MAIFAIVGCTSDDYDTPATSTDGKVAVDMVLSVSTSSSSTRMATDVVTPTSLSNLDFSIFPFSIPTDQDTINSSNTSWPELTSAFNQEGQHYMSDQIELTIGTNAFLCYANLNHGNTYSKVDNGSLQVSGTDVSTSFKLDPILQTPTTPNADAVKILGYMNEIATVETTDGRWNESTDEIIASEFDKFINHGQSIAGSSRNIIAYINYWYKKNISDPYGSAIRGKIEEHFTVNNGDVTAIKDVESYPVGLPDGNAVITWNSTKQKFEYDEIKWNTTSYEYVAGEDKFLGYTYPAERYFYANSRIKTSTSSQKSNYGASRWSEKENASDAEGVLDYYDNVNVVSSATRSVAIKNPLSYGVAGMEILIKANASTDDNGKYLRDDDSKHENYADSRVALGATAFPLKAIIVGSQVEQNYCFEPARPDNKTESESRIYDTKVKAVKTPGNNPEEVCLGETDPETYANPVYTLGLQTKDGVSTKIVLEFENNSQDFISENGIIYKGTKFYMVASVVPPTNEGVGKRVMTRGHMTVVNLTIKSLKSAYNALPDLRSDKLRLFDVVEAGIRKWQTGQTGEHEFFNW